MQAIRTHPIHVAEPRSGGLTGGIESERKAGPEEKGVQATKAPGSNFDAEAMPSICYDPTNGALSAGDIFRWKSEIP